MLSYIVVLAIIIFLSYTTVIEANKWALKNYTRFLGRVINKTNPYIQYGLVFLTLLALIHLTFLRKSGLLNPSWPYTGAFFVIGSFTSQTIGALRKKKLKDLSPDSLEPANKQDLEKLIHIPARVKSPREDEPSVVASVEEMINQIKGDYDLGKLPLVIEITRVPKLLRVILFSITITGGFFFMVLAFAEDYAFAILGIFLLLVSISQIFLGPLTRYKFRDIIKKIKTDHPQFKIDTKQVNYVVTRNSLYIMENIFRPRRISLEDVKLLALLCLTFKTTISYGNSKEKQYS